MKRLSLFYIFVAVFVLSVFVVTAHAQEEADTVKELSVYGEVQDVSQASNSISVQYYDYDSDEEKMIELVSDSNTKIENAASLAEITKGSWVDVIYAAAGGKNIAKSILVEKEEEPVMDTETVENDMVPVDEE